MLFLNFKYYTMYTNSINSNNNGFDYWLLIWKLDVIGFTEHSVM